ncbi:MAG: ABC transporter permease, partial [Gemmatimonadales bacterium]
MSVPLPAVDVTAVDLAPARWGWVTAVLAFARQRTLGAIGAALVALMAGVALLAPVLAPYDPLTTDYGAMLAAPSTAHWLGTDAHGRDVLTRIIYGAWTALLVGFGASVPGATLGAMLGVASAYFGGRIDLVVQRAMDVMLSFPLIILALAVVVILG